MAARTWLMAAGALVIVAGIEAAAGQKMTPPPKLGQFIVLGYNDLGMHCMNKDFSEMMILPPFNTLHAVVVDRSGPKAVIVKSGIEVDYCVPNTALPTSVTNFWKYEATIFGFKVPKNVGLTGNALSGKMALGANDWLAAGIPLTPVDNRGRTANFQLATITVRNLAKKAKPVMTTTQAVAPVSWEIRCDYCHYAPGTTTTMAILQAHDKLHLAKMQQMHPGMPPLTQSTPVVCGTCHVQPELQPLGITSDDPGNPTLSSAMHLAHAPRLPGYMPSLKNECYGCHPGVQTQCFRDVHAAGGMTCTDCHGGMAEVANPSRTPWVDMPRCENCHPLASRPDHAAYQFEQPGTLFRNSVGHGGIPCEGCHNSTHAILPSIQPNDNVQAIALQGRAGTICDCRICHSTMPSGPFVHAAPTP